MVECQILWTILIVVLSSFIDIWARQKNQVSNQRYKCPGEILFGQHEAKIVRIKFIMGKSSVAGTRNEAWLHNWIWNTWGQEKNSISYKLKRFMTFGVKPRSTSYKRPKQTPCSRLVTLQCFCTFGWRDIGPWQINSMCCSVWIPSPHVLSSKLERGSGPATSLNCGRPGGSWPAMLAMYAGHAAHPGHVIHFQCFTWKSTLANAKLKSLYSMPVQYD